jgi:hypothetical protein
LRIRRYAVVHLRVDPLRLAAQSSEAVRTSIRTRRKVTVVDCEPVPGKLTFVRSFKNWSSSRLPRLLRGICTVVVPPATTLYEPLPTVTCVGLCFRRRLSPVTLPALTLALKVARPEHVCPTTPWQVILTDAIDPDVDPVADTVGGGATTKAALVWDDEPAKF